MSDARNPIPGSLPPAYSFEARILVRFSDCDPAGIAFYPRLLEMFNNLVEDWCREGLNFSFDDIVIKRGWGLPTVHLEADFLAPCCLGEVLTARLFVRGIGTSSIKADIGLSGPEGSDRVRGSVVLVLMDRQSGRAMALPDALRQSISSFVVTA